MAWFYPGASAAPFYSIAAVSIQPEIKAKVQAGFFAGERARLQLFPLCALTGY